MKFLLTSYVSICFTTLFSNAMYNGEYRPITDLPYMAQVLDNFEYACSAAIISADWILSAGHCVGHVHSSNRTLIITGSSTTLKGKPYRRVTKIFVRGNYQPINLNGDISLLKLEKPIEFDEYQQPIQIARTFSLKAGDNVTVAGYGIHHHSVNGIALRSARVPIIEHERCNDILKENIDNISINDSQFCTSTGKAELCAGDSGGPAIFNNKLIGITSFGCDGITPNGFTKVAYYYDWIMRTTGIKYDD